MINAITVPAAILHGFQLMLLILGRNLSAFQRMVFSECMSIYKSSALKLSTYGITLISLLINWLSIKASPCLCFYLSKCLQL